MPADNQFVLVLDGKNEIWTAQWIFKPQSSSNPAIRFWSFKVDNDNCCSCTWPDLKDVTHWMPLPEKPLDANMVRQIVKLLDNK
jgi:hypothetical protein